MRVYPWAQRNTPPETKFVNLSGRKFGKLFDPTDNEAMSGRGGSIPPRVWPAPDPPPVENWMIIPGQCLSSPSLRAAYFSGRLL